MSLSAAESVDGSLRMFRRHAPLVLVNGLAEQTETWYRNAHAWREHFDVYIPHLAAYDSEVLHRRINAGMPISVDYLVEQLRVYLDSFVARGPYFFAANSMGGKIMVEFAVRYPDQVAKLALICPSGLSEVERLPIVEGVRGRKMQEVIQSVFHNSEQADPQVVAMYEKQVRNKRWRTGMMHTVRGTMGHLVRDRVGELQCPTLMIVGQEDRIVDPKDSIAAAGRIPHCQLVVIESCGHAPQLERTEYVNRLVVDFLKEEEAAGNETTACQAGFLRIGKPR
ncbi:MAG: alpha/beta hydrolase [Pirellulales bacterium]|nr:alpha/beta hydrolase [Pirellulales bacterium]